LRSRNRLSQTPVTIVADRKVANLEIVEKTSYNILETLLFLGTPVGLHRLKRLLGSVKEEANHSALEPGASNQRASG